MDVQEELRSRLRPVSFMAAAAVGGLLVALVVGEFIRYRLRPFTGFASLDGASELRYIFFGAAVAAVVLVRVLRQALLRKPPADDARAALRRLQQASFLTLVLSEIPAILGFVLFLLGGFNIDLYVLIFVSLFLIFMYCPRRSSWEEWLRG